NPLHVDNPATYHWFVGDGMVHGVRLQGGEARWYRNRWSGSDPARRAQGKALTPAPRRGVSDVLNTNVVGHAGSIWASTDAGVLPVELDEELNTIRYGYFNTHESLPFTAHPHLDPATGQLHAICYDATNPRAVDYVMIGRQGELVHRTSVPVQHGPMIHDCAITGSHVLVLDLPVTLSYRALLSGASFPYRWNPKHAARVGAVPHGGDASQIRWWSVDPCAVFHTCNAYDLDDGSMVMDVGAHPRMFDRSTVRPDLQDHEVSLERWTPTPPGSQVKRHVWSTLAQEFPRCNETLIGRPYRYAYSVGFSSDLKQAMPLIRHDLHTGDVLKRDLGDDALPGEFVFVPRPGGVDEDDGWLMGYVLHQATERTELLILNAQDFTGPP